jgi:hypothetical protein
MGAERYRLPAGTTAEFGKGYCLLLIFIDPECDEWPLAWGSIQGLDQIAITEHRIL